MTTRRPRLPSPGKEYSKQYMDQLLLLLEQYFSSIDNPGDAIVSTLQILRVPTSGANLPDGSVWNDGGTLKITQQGTAYVGSQTITAQLGTVTVTTS